MRKRLLAVCLSAIVLAVVGCSNSEDNATGPDNSAAALGTDTTFFNAAKGYYVTTLSAKQSPAVMEFSAHTGMPKVHGGDWDLMFDVALVNTNSGASSDGGDVKAADLGAVSYDEVTAADSTGASWQQDALQHIINEWYSYNIQTHQLDMTGYVYSLTDVEGDNYIKMTIDSITGGGQPPAMGTVWFSYYYNPTAKSRNLTGDPVVGSVEVTQANGYWGYFDFSAGSQVYPADAANSIGWDIGFNNYELFLNCGPNGPGSTTAYPAHGDLTDPTSLAECTEQPTDSPMFQDYIASVFNGDINNPSANWYNYDISTHVLTSKAHVYLVLTGSGLFKLRIESYYRNIGGVPVSGYYTVIWNEL